MLGQLNAVPAHRVLPPPTAVQLNVRMSPMHAQLTLLGAENFLVAVVTQSIVEIFADSVNINCLWKDALQCLIIVDAHKHSNMLNSI